MNTNKPQLEDFMVFKDKNGDRGVIIKNDSDDCLWWKCIKDSIIGQRFNEQGEHYNNIVKLYKVKYGYDKYFCALKFMNNGKLDKYDCVYEYVKPIEEVQLVNITINLTVNNPKNTEEIMNERN